MFEVVVDLIASKSIFLFLILVQRKGGANRCKPAIGCLFKGSVRVLKSCLTPLPFLGWLISQLACPISGRRLSFQPMPTSLMSEEEVKFEKEKQVVGMSGSGAISWKGTRV